ncbi:restriction endonuclease subunit S [Candidatus Poriferisodalis sp.]|uniref:restriction endonuclease subunit S n=1 Tax=Candidatus Poriferisodalis sp. TaxID=3101277 RepID=UPI003B52BA01
MSSERVKSGLLGVLPDGWSAERLGHIGLFLRGGGDSKQDEVDDGLPCVRYGDLYTHHDCRITDTRSRISPDRVNSYTPLRYGDVLFASSGETVDDIGRSAVNLMRGRAYCGGDVIILRPAIEINSSFLGHVADCTSSRIQKSRLGRGSTVIHIYDEELRDLVIPVPPPEEQRQIAKILDTVDDTIKATDRVIAKLVAARVGLLREQLAPGMTDSPPPDWEVVRVEELLGHRSPAMRSGPFGSFLLASELVNEGVPLLGIDNVQREHFVADYRRFVTPDKSYELRRYRVRPRDIMITIMGTVGRCCVVPDSIGEAVSSKHVWTLTLDQERYLPELACLQMNYAPWVLAHFCRDEQGGIMSAIRSETLRSLRLPTPPMAEQRRMWAMLRALARRIEAEAESLSKLRELRSGLAADLLSGRVRTVAA